MWEWQRARLVIVKPFKNYNFLLKLSTFSVRSIELYEMFLESLNIYINIKYFIVSSILFFKMQIHTHIQCMYLPFLKTFCPFALFSACFVLFSFSLVELSHGQHKQKKHKQKNSLFYCCEFKFDTTHAIFAHILEYFYMHTNTLEPAHTHIYRHTHTHSHGPLAVDFNRTFRAFFEFCINFLLFHFVYFDLVFR